MASFNRSRHPGGRPATSTETGAPARAQKRSGALDAESADLLAMARDDKAYDKLIAGIVAAREGAHDRERLAQAAEAKLAEERADFEAAQNAAEESIKRDSAAVRQELDGRANDLSSLASQLDARSESLNQREVAVTARETAAGQQDGELKVRTRGTTSAARTCRSPCR